MPTRSLLLAWVILLFLSACGNPTQPTKPQNVSSSQDVAFVVPTPAERYGVITGQLLTPDENGEPYLTTLYLATLVYPAEGGENAIPLIAFSEEDAIQGVQDPASGRFYFADVPPDTYAIILWTPVVSMPLRDPKTGSEIIFDVRANEVTDLGLIVIP